MSHSSYFLRHPNVNERTTMTTDQTTEPTDDITDADLPPELLVPSVRTDFIYEIYKKAGEDWERTCWILVDRMVSVEEEVIRRHLDEVDELRETRDLAAENFRKLEEARAKIDELRAELSQERWQRLIDGDVGTSFEGIVGTKRPKDDAVDGMTMTMKLFKEKSNDPEIPEAVRRAFQGVGSVSIHGAGRHAADAVVDLDLDARPKGYDHMGGVDHGGISSFAERVMGLVLDPDAEHDPIMLTPQDPPIAETPTGFQGFHDVGECATCDHLRAVLDREPPVARPSYIEADGGEGAPGDLNVVSIDEALQGSGLDLDATNTFEEPAHPIYEHMFFDWMDAWQMKAKITEMQAYGWTVASLVHIPGRTHSLSSFPADWHLVLGRKVMQS